MSATVNYRLEPAPGRVPPNDLDAEAAVLSAILLDAATTIDVVRDVIPNPAVMYADANRRILEAAYRLADVGTPVDVLTVAGLLRDTGRLDQIGGTPYLGQLADATPVVAHAEDHARRIVDKARLRAMIAVCQMKAAEGYGDIVNPQEWLSGCEQLVFDAAADTLKVDAAQTMAELVPPVMREIRERQQDKGETGSGLITCCPALTKFLGAFTRGQPYVVGARPGMGKSAFALQCCVEVARAGECAVFESAEMNKQQTVRRAIAQEARVDSKKLRFGGLTAAEVHRVNVASTALSRMPLSICFRPGGTIPQIRGDVRRSLRTQRDKFGAALKLGMVAVDYIQVLDGRRGGSDTRENEVSALSKNLMWMAQETDAVVLVLSQLNRAVETRGGGKDTAPKRPQLSDFRDSGSLEQDGYGVLTIYRDEYYTKEASLDKGVAEIGVLKHRDDETGIVRLRFTGFCTRFDDELEIPPELANFGEEPERRYID